MPKRSSNAKTDKPDSTQTTLGTPREVTGDTPNTKLPKEKNPAAVALGRLGGLKGGKARAKKLTAKERSDIAKKAAEKRWGYPDS